MTIEDAARSGTAWPAWLTRRRADFGILALGAFQIIGTHFAAQEQHGHEALDGWAYALLALPPLALMARRRFPGTALVAVFLATLTYRLLDYPQGPVYLLLIVALFSAMIRGRRLVAWTVLAAGYVAFLWLPDLSGAEGPPSSGAIAGLAAWLLLLGTLAEIARARRERAGEIARTRAEEARRRASEERLRIARELHDTLGHHLSLINVQSGVGLHLMEQHPEQARSALTAIKDASKEALTELRSVLAILRQVDEDAPRTPAPSLSRLDDLVSRSTSAGLAVETRVEGDTRPLPFGVDLAAYRIVQEALTNVARHAGAAHASVHVTYGERDVTVEVEDDGRGASSHGASRDGAGKGGGTGIPGMRERATAVGGEFEAGPRPGGGFRVRARLPVDGAG